MPFHLGHHAPLPVPASGLITETGIEAQNVVGRAADGSPEQMGDACLKNLVLRQTDRVQEALGFEIFVHLRRGEGGVTSEIQSSLPTLVANDNRFQHAFPVIGRVDVAGTQGAPFQITELVEQEQGMVASASEVSVVGCSLLVAVGRADARVHVEDDHLRWATVMNSEHQDNEYESCDNSQQPNNYWDSTKWKFFIVF